MTVRSRSLAGGVLALILIGALSACATPAGPGSGGDSASPSDAGTPSADAGADDDIEAAWLDGGRMVGLVTYGSSTCLPTASAGEASEGVLEVELTDDADAACTRDLVPRVTLVQITGDVDPAQGLEIRVRGEGYEDDVQLDGVPGLAGASETDYLPSAGWAGDDRFVVLSWGSSGCAPVLQSATVTSASEVAVAFEEPPADQVCTMDMAPRGLVVQVDGELDDDSEVFAVLTGAEFDNVRVPILGRR